jgi:hypothetical protein
MPNRSHSQHRRSGLFGRARQGHLIIAIIVVGTALLAATRTDWASMLVSALVLPLIMVAVIYLVSQIWRNGPEGSERSRGPRQETDLLTFLARTNPLMFLLFGTASRGVDDDRYGELLGFGPYGMGGRGYVIALVVVLGPLLISLIIMALTGQLPTHSTPHIP